MMDIRVITMIEQTPINDPSRELPIINDSCVSDFTVVWCELVDTWVVVMDVEVMVD